MDSGALAARLAELGALLPPTTHLLAVSKTKPAQSTFDQGSPC